MNYYEELGVTAQATEQEIRKAHRRLVKLMHPDAQPDQNLKVMAEAQMRRLNSMVSTLLDPDQRRAYDEQLEFANTSSEREAPPTSWAGMSWWFASALGAVVLTLGAVWLWADHMGSALHTRNSRTTSIAAVDTGPPLSGAEIAPLSGAGDEKTATSAQPAGDVSATVASSHASPEHPLPGHFVPNDTAAAAHISPPPPASGSLQASSALPLAQRGAPGAIPVRPDQGGSGKQSNAKKVPANVLDSQQQASVAAPTSGPRVSSKDVTHTASPSPASGQPASPQVIASAAPAGNDSANSPSSPPDSAAPVAARDPVPSSPSAAIPESAGTQTAEADISGASAESPGSHDPLEGEWIYAPKGPERRKAGFYPPEYIDLKLFDAGDPGSLKGEYSAKYVVTDRPVSPEVTFELASISRGSRKFVWQSSNGAKGTLSIDPIDERTIRVDWHTTSAIREPALTSGQATLVRRQ